MEGERKKKSKGFLTLLKKQMAQLTVNYASQRQKRDSGVWGSSDVEEACPDYPEGTLQRGSRPALKRCNTLPYRLDAKLSLFANPHGRLGLANHGNTCYINAVLQCLSHTDLLTEYFVTNQYKNDLNQSKWKTSTYGEVTEQFANLLKAMRSSQYHPEMTLLFKDLLGKHDVQYQRNTQQDAQEFLLWLLDKIHEDLNSANKKLKKVKKFYGSPDEIQAADTLAKHLRFNSSFVQQLFQAQFQSSLTCHACLQQSSTFDPFLCISLPIPQSATKCVYVTVVYQTPQRKQVRFGLGMNALADIREVKQKLSSETGISSTRLLLVEIGNSSFSRTFQDDEPISLLKENDPLYCIELPSSKKQRTNENDALVSLCWINVDVSSKKRTRFGRPYVLEVSRETSFRDLQIMLLSEMEAICDGSIFEAARQGWLLRIQVWSETMSEAFYLDPGMDFPLYSELVDEVLSMRIPGSTRHLTLVLEWDTFIKQRYILDAGSHVEERAVPVKKQQAKSGRVTLEDCFQLYTQAEQLGPEDTWYCPNCKRKQEATKKLTLWTCPDVLIVHLKRFRQSSTSGVMSKVGTKIDFPLSGLDMGNHVAPRSSISSQSDADSGFWKSTLSLSGLRRNSRHLSNLNNNYYHTSGYGSRSRLEDNVYDLYAICNHHGNDLASGHYTAYCRNPADANWYFYDDSRVTRISEAHDIVSSSAYILFYKRRAPSVSGAQTSSPTSSTGSDQRTYGLSSNKQITDTSQFDRKDPRYMTLPSKLRTSGGRRGSLWSLNSRKSGAILV